jgi:hypothetical protein
MSDHIDFRGSKFHEGFDPGTPGEDVVILSDDATDAPSDAENSDTGEGHECDGNQYGGRHIDARGRVFYGPVIGKKAN